MSCSPSGNSSPLRDLPPQDAQGRFQLVFQRFIGVFARPEHPLALFLDDLQWLDAATLDLLEDLLTRPDVRHLVLIGAYRSQARATREARFGRSLTLPGASPCAGPSPRQPATGNTDTINIAPHLCHYYEDVGEDC